MPSQSTPGRRPLDLVHRGQRALLVLVALVAGAPSLLMLILPHQVGRELAGRPLSVQALVMAQMAAAWRLGVALTALVAALAPRPPRSLVWAVTLAVGLSALGVAYLGLLNLVPAPELAPFSRWMWLEATLALLLGASHLLRAALRRRT
jgi:hypothetical protein